MITFGEPVEATVSLECGYFSRGHIRKEIIARLERYSLDYDIQEIKRRFGSGTITITAKGKRAIVKLFLSDLKVWLTRGNVPYTHHEVNNNVR